MDAILEYTGMSNFPRVFSEDGVLAGTASYLKNKQNDLEYHNYPTLPQRMEDNRLHRFSKVLETNIGADQTASTRLLPQCRRLKACKAQPLNRTAPTNLYRAQKLMSLNANIDLESLLISNKNKPRTNSDDVIREVDDWLGNMANFASMENDDSLPFYSNRSVYHISNQMLFWIFCFLCVLCYIGYKCYRKKRKFFLRRKLRNINIKSMSSRYFLNNKSTSPRKTNSESVSPHTSPRTVYVDKLSVRRKGDTTSISNMISDSKLENIQQRDELLDVSNTEHATPYTQNKRSHDTYKRIV